MRSIYLLFFLVLVSINGCHAAQESIVVGGWTFTANLGDEWKADSTAPVESFNDWSDCYSKDVFWSGTQAALHFFIPKGPTELHYSGIGGKSGRISVQVLQIPEQFKGLKMPDLLKAAVDLNHCPTVNEGSEKDIQFDGRDAHLWEKDETMDGKDYSDGIIAVKLNDTAIGTITIERWDDAGRAWDAMDTFTITPAT